MFVDTAKITATGQVTIPQSIRERFGLRAGMLVLFEETAQGELRLRQVTADNPLDNLRELQARFPLQAATQEPIEGDGAQIELIKAEKIQYLRQLHAHAEAAGDKRSARWYARKTGLSDKTVKAYLDNPNVTDRAKLGQGRKY